jgi:hypothetical protein
VNAGGQAAPERRTDTPPPGKATQGVP